jgi:hypothetical protein
MLLEECRAGERTARPEHLRAPGSGLPLTFAVSINEHGEIASLELLPNGDQHAFELIPCDENHSGRRRLRLQPGWGERRAAQAAKFIKPGESPFDHPAPSAQSTTMCRVALRPPATIQSGRRAPASPARRSESIARHLPAPSHVTFASRSSRNHSSSPGQHPPGDPA